MVRGTGSITQHSRLSTPRVSIRHFTVGLLRKERDLFRVCCSPRVHFHFRKYTLRVRLR